MTLNSPEIEALYPDGETPELRLKLPSAIHSLTMRHRFIGGTLRQVFLQHFCDSRHVYDPWARAECERLGGWTDNEASSIYIETLEAWKPESMRARPAVIIRSNEYQYKRVAIGDANGAVWETGQQFFGGLWTGSHTVFVVTKGAAESQAIAAECTRVLQWLAKPISNLLLLHRFVPVTWGAIISLQELPDYYAVPVTVACASEERWSLQEDAPRTKRIVIQADQLT